MPLSPGDKDELKAMMQLPEFEEAIRSRLPSLVAAMFDLATGVQMIERKRDPDNKEEWGERVYWKAPDRQAAQFLIENVIGKVPTRVEMTGKDGEPMKIIPWMPKLEAIEEGIVETLDEDEVKMLTEAKDAQTQ